MGFVSDIADVFSFSARKERRKQHGIRMKALDRAEVVMSAAWEAADNDRFRGEKWLTSELSTNSNLEIELTTLWDRAEDLARNDAYASSAVNGRVDNVIGSGMSFHSRVKPWGDVVSDNDARKINDRREQVFELWARKDNFRQNQRLFERSKAIFGEGLAVWSDVPITDGRPIPLTWQVVNPRRLETPPDMEGDTRVRLGIQFTTDDLRDIEGYWIRDTEKNDSKEQGETYKFFPKMRVQHSFEPLVPGQIRAVPWLTPVMGKIKDIKDYSETKLIAEQAGACTTTWIKTADPYGRAVGASTGTDSSGRRVQEISPGEVHYIAEDDDVQFNDPNRPGNTYAPYIEHHLMGLAAGIRYSYALLTKDFRKASFANGRLEMADARKTFECWQRADIDDAFCEVAERATEEMVMLGKIPEIEPSMYRAFPETCNEHQFKPPRWRMAVNPKQENEADVVDVENLFSSRTDKCDERESEFDEVLTAREREEIQIAESESRINKIRESLGLSPLGNLAGDNKNQANREPNITQQQLEEVEV
jgi:lambda family phage portal protein